MSQQNTHIDFPPNINVRADVPLAPFTNIDIGGPADYLVKVSDQDIFIQLIRFCREQRIPFIVLGDGTNVFFPDDGFRGMVISIEFDRICTLGKNAILAEAGASLSRLIQTCIENGLTGLEFASGIPGTVGGAVYGNAGAYGNDIGHILTRAKIVTPDGETRFVDKDYFAFRYRHSILKKQPAFVLQAEFQLDRGEPESIQKVCDDIIATRTAKLPPPDIKTAGSWFKNIKDQQGRATPAAKLLEAVGSKQLEIGDAAVHHKHANIFYNKAHATASDLLKLEDILRKRVIEKFNITLEREVMYIK